MLGVNHLSILVRMRRNDAKNMIPPRPPPHPPPPSPFPSISVISRFSTKQIVFQKFFECLYDKKANTIFEELSNLCLVVQLISSFPLLLWITVENQTNLKKSFILTPKSGGIQHHKRTNCTLLFISNCNNVSDILG